MHEAGRFWLVKPRLYTDTADIRLLEHARGQWGAASGLDFARTAHHRLGDGLSVVRTLRFDRPDDRRSMAISGASLLQTEYPDNVAAGMVQWSYPRLAEELKRIGAPQADRIELFGRMVFNAVVGNDEDHPRNHAAIYDSAEKRWRLAPAFDVVPNPDQHPRRLAMQLALGRREVARDAALADAIRFGFDSQASAAMYLDDLLRRIEAGFAQAQALLPTTLRTLMAQGLRENLSIFRSAPAN